MHSYGSIEMNDITAHVVSLELSQRLKRLGVKQKSYFCHVERLTGYHNETEWSIVPRIETKIDEIAKHGAWLASELGEMLPERLDKYRHRWIKLCKLKCEANNEYHWLVTLVEEGGSNADYIEYDCSHTNMANALAKMLIGLIENDWCDAEWKSKWLNV